MANVKAILDVTPDQWGRVSHDGAGLGAVIHELIETAQVFEIRASRSSLTAIVKVPIDDRVPLRELTNTLREKANDAVRLWWATINH
jgi:hypothetical protein